jgi:hypothetical protein
MAARKTTKQPQSSEGASTATSPVVATTTTNLPTTQDPQQPPDPPKLRHIGRPRKWTDAEQIYAVADQYFNECVEKKTPLTITGLCQALGTTRQTMMDYLNNVSGSVSINHTGVESADILDALKHVKARCERYAEEHGFSARNPAFAIFALKNYGWKDTQTIETTGFVEHRIDDETKAILGDFMASLSGRSAPALADVVEYSEIAHKDSLGVDLGVSQLVPVNKDKQCR